MDPIEALKKLTSAVDKVRTAEGKAALVDQIDGLRGALLDTREAISELHDKIAAQREEIGSLKAELASRDSWDAEAARYRLTKMDSGVFVQVLRPEAANGEPEHCACPKCFAAGQKQVLQRQSNNKLWSAEDVWRALYACPACASEYSFGTLPIEGPTAQLGRVRQSRAEYF